MSACVGRLQSKWSRIRRLVVGGALTMAARSLVHLRDVGLKKNESCAQPHLHETPSRCAGVATGIQPARGSQHAHWCLRTLHKAALNYLDCLLCCGGRGSGPARCVAHFSKWVWGRTAGFTQLHCNSDPPPLNCRMTTRVLLAQAQRRPCRCTRHGPRTCSGRTGDQLH